jgi:cytochrome b pre-mRNA-processing protein 3
MLEQIKTKLARLLGTEEDPRERLRPLWHRTVELARMKHWYSSCHVADSVSGRFDMICAVLSVIMVRLESSELRSESALLAELFVEDMDGQLREFGVNDVVVGKRVGKLMGTLGGRLGAIRSALAGRDEAKLTEAMQRNITYSDEASPQCVARHILALHEALAKAGDEALIAADFALAEPA